MNIGYASSPAQHTLEVLPPYSGGNTLGPRNTRALLWCSASPLNPCELVVGPVFHLPGRDMFLGFSYIHGVCLKFSSSPWLGAWMVDGRLFLCLPKLGNRACWGGKEKVAEVAVRVASTPSWCDTPVGLHVPTRGQQERVGPSSDPTASLPTLPQDCGPHRASGSFHILHNKGGQEKP